MAEIAELARREAPNMVNPKPTLVIEPPRGWKPIDLGELWAYREMIWRLTLRDIKSRYKQSVLGPTWVILIPLAQAGIFSLILGGLAGLPSGGIPYPVFVYCGMLVWQLFMRGFQQTAGSIANNENLITKVYFPRLIAPIAGAAGSILDFLLGVGVFIFILTSRLRLKQIPSSNILIPAFYAAFAGWFLTVLEGFFWESFLNYLEHICYAASSVLVACWCWKVFGRKKEAM